MGAICFILHVCVCVGFLPLYFLYKKKTACTFLLMGYLRNFFFEFFPRCFPPSVGKMAKLVVRIYNNNNIIYFFILKEKRKLSGYKKIRQQLTHTFSFDEKKNITHTPPVPKYFFSFYLRHTQVSPNHFFYNSKIYYTISGALLLLLILI